MRGYPPQRGGGLIWAFIMLMEQRRGDGGGDGGGIRLSDSFYD